VYYITTLSVAKVAAVMDEWMSMEQWWNNANCGKPKCLEKNLLYCYVVHYKFHMDWPAIEPDPPQKEVCE
jgi:hypothetical protein